MIIIVAAVAVNGVIGKGDELPWKLLDDLSNFKRITSGQTVVQGRNTLCSIIKRLHRPLPGRRNIVLTRRPGEFKIDGVEVLTSFEQVIELAKTETLYVIGGAELYKAALPVADQMHLTDVRASVDGDVFFPDWNRDEWSEIDSHLVMNDERNEFPFVIRHLVRRRA